MRKTIGYIAAAGAAVFLYTRPNPLWLLVYTLIILTGSAFGRRG